MTAVIRRAEAVLQAEMRMRSSMRLSLTSLHPDWMMKTSSSRTDSDILTLISPFENVLTVQGTRGTLSLARVWKSCTGSGDRGCESAAHRSATAWASSGWLLPVMNVSSPKAKKREMSGYEPARILIEFPWCMGGEEQIFWMGPDHIIVWSSQTSIL